MAGNQKVTTENINEVILRLLKINSGLELDYQTYYEIIKKKLASARLIGKELPREEDELLRNEFKRVKNKKGRFKVKTSKAKVSVSPPPSAPPSPSSGGGNRPRGGKIAKSPSGKITANNSFFQQYIDPVKVRDITEKSAKISRTSSDNSESLKTSLDNINKTLDSIVNTLTDINDRNRNQLEEKRKEEENKKRKSREGELESKTFDGIKKAISAITKPFQSIWDKILNFIGNIILGRILIKLVNWIADPKNQGKIKSIIRFFKDWWPALLGSYVLFGTTFGKFVRGTVGMLGRFIFQIGKVAIPQLLKFIRTPLGKGIALFTAGATIPAMFPQTVNEQERKTEKAPGSKDDKIKQLQTQKANLNVFERLQGKGSEIDEQIYFLQTGKTKQYGFSGGGFSGGLGSGLVNGPKGRDRVPAMLTDGEFVMSVGAVNKYGVETLEAMNAAGGGTNQPQVVGGKTYAYGGGEIRRDSGGGNDFEKLLYAMNKWFLSKGINLQEPQTWGPTTNEFASNSANFINRTAGQIGNIKLDPNQIGNIGMNAGVQAQKYLQGDQLKKDVSSLIDSSAKFGSGLYSQSLNYGNKVLSDIKSGKIQDKASQTVNQISQIPKNTGAKFFDTMKNVSSSKRYNDLSKGMEKIQDRQITFGDSFIRKLPDGPFKEIADKGLIPIPSGNATTMRNLTFLKSILGPLGRPFKILSNPQVDKMRMQTIEQTMGKNGLKVDPKTGKVTMNWNQEDINKGAKGGGAYSDKVSGGSAANSILGRFTASTKPGGDVLYSDDRYNFNRTVGEYAQLAKEGLLKGSFSDATYFGASMLGRFAQDIGWLNQRALGSEIKIGKIDRSKIDPSTGKQKTPEQLKKDQQKAIAEQKKIKKQQENQRKLEEKRPWWDKMGWFGGGSAKVKEEEKKKKEFLKKNKSAKLYDKPQKNTKQPTKSRFTRPKTATKTPVKPIPKPAANKKTSQYKGGQRSSKSKGSTKSSKPPSFSPNHSAKSTKTARSTYGVKK
jgi:hypothetical protein